MAVRPCLFWFVARYNRSLRGGMFTLRTTLYLQRLNFCWKELKSVPAMKSYAPRTVTLLSLNITFSHFRKKLTASRAEDAGGFSRRDVIYLTCCAAPGRRWWCEGYLAFCHTSTASSSEIAALSTYSRYRSGLSWRQVQILRTSVHSICPSLLFGLNGETLAETAVLG